MSLNALYSHAYLRKSDYFRRQALRIAPHSTVLIDSGAFTEYHAALKDPEYVPLSLDEYIDDCRQHYHGTVWQYIALDVVRNAKATRTNLANMVKAGLTPMPVYVAREDVAIVPELVSINKHICVAGGVDAQRQYAIQRYQKAYKVSGGKARMHALGFVKYPIITKLPVYSVDSSSWCIGARFGHIIRFQPEQGLTHLTSWQDLGKEENKSWVDWLLSQGVTRRQLNDPAHFKSNHGIPALFSAKAYVEMMLYLEHNYGQKLFLAIPNTGWTTVAYVVYHYVIMGWDYDKCRSHYRSLVNLRNEKGYDALDAASIDLVKQANAKLKKIGFGKTKWKG